MAGGDPDGSLELGLVLLASAAASRASLVDPFPDHMFPPDPATHDCNLTALRRCLAGIPAGAAVAGHLPSGRQLTVEQERLLLWQAEKLRLRRAPVDTTLCQLDSIRPADRTSWWAAGPRRVSETRSCAAGQAPL